MNGTMQDEPLLVRSILTRGRDVYGDCLVISVTSTRGDAKESTFGQLAERSARLAAALQGLGIDRGDRVATLCWNTAVHMEVYLAVPTMGAVLHTLNLRLSPEQLTYVINHARDKVVIVDQSLLPVLEAIRRDLVSVEHVVVVEGTSAGPTIRPGALLYETLLGEERGDFDWPDLDERQAAAMCYTSGTTGNPRGVVYTHRSIVLHSMSVASASAFGLTDHDRALIVVPMFHVNAWGTPYAAYMVGCDLVMPQQYVQPGPLSQIIARYRPTISAGMPTIWYDFARYAETNEADLSSLRMIVAGGALVPRSLIEQFDSVFGVPMVQAWGMTETSPLCAMALPPRGSDPQDAVQWRSRTGRVLAGVELRVVRADGEVLPRDGKAIGEIEVKGPWVTGSYYGDSSGEQFHDGWLRTGDVGSIDPRGFMQISDRIKDVIKSGGEWISSLELENALAALPDVWEAAVIAVPDDKWSERPLACVVRADGSEIGADDLRAALGQRFPRWWLPEQWAFLPDLPKTSVGKLDKKALRADHAAGKIRPVRLSPDASWVSSS